MSITRQNQRGFSHVETLLLVVIVAVIGTVGWYVYHTKQTSDKVLDAAASTSNNASPHFATKTSAATASTTNGTDNQSLQTDLNSASSATNQDSQDINSTNSSLNDQSTFTSVPQ